MTTWSSKKIKESENAVNSLILTSHQSNVVAIERQEHNNNKRTCPNDAMSSEQA